MSTLHEVKLHELHPTQITVGMFEVHDKIHELNQLKPHEQRDYLAAHPMPAVRRADDELYITDHHHLGRALWETGIGHAFVVVEKEWRNFGLEHFWHAMIDAHWAHPVDARGERRPYREIPGHLKELRDDVYRSLAAFVRMAGGFEKTPTPFAEFAWADWFRRRVTIGPTREDFDRAVAESVKLAHSAAASALPGYRAG